MTTEFKKADLTHRLLARFIDFLIGAAFCLVLFPVGVLMGATYIAIADGLFGGQSLGKRIIGLRVVRAADGGPITFKDSLIRNSIYAVIYLFYLIPYLRWVLIPTVGLIIVAFEVYYLIVDLNGFRVGDLAADTRVIDDPALR
jgi:uncharacterized RDD family membrane protein YckC